MDSTTSSEQPTQRKDGRAWAIRVLFSAGEIIRPDPYFLPAGATMVGRAPEEIHDLCFDADPAMSRKHATLDQTAGVLTLTDHSRNGSEVNGEPAESVTLQSGDLIRCGDTFAVARLEPMLSDDAPVRGLLGVSAVAQQVRSAIAEVATTGSAVILHGEAGTGKGIAARAIHDLSGCSGPWVQINCAAIPEAIGDGALFHATGTAGRDADDLDAFADAGGGTLFIDEIGELSLKHQQRLLDILDNGATSLVPDIRLVTSSHRELGTEVHAGNFSLELHARLATVVIWLPPLRERIEDLLGVLCSRMGEHPPLSTSLVDALLHYHWPHNFREVERIATELTVRGAGYVELVPELIEGHLQSPLLRPAPSVPSQQPPPQRQAPPSADALMELLGRHRGDVTGVAAALGQTVGLVERWLAQHHIDPGDHRS